MSAVEGFVHLYHVWGMLGALTAVVFGREAWVGWREAGGTFRSAPREWAYALQHVSTEAARDVVRLFKWAGKSALGAPFIWETAQWRGRTYPRRQTILIGITLGGLSRMMTAMYWAERNRDWMEHTDMGVIVAASVVILPAVIGDLHHHMTAWPDKQHRVRLTALGSAAWVLYGLFFGTYIDS